MLDEKGSSYESYQMWSTSGKTIKTFFSLKMKERNHVPKKMASLGRGMSL